MNVLMYFEKKYAEKMLPDTTILNLCQWFASSVIIIISCTI